MELSVLQSQDLEDFLKNNGADEVKFVENWKSQALPPEKKEIPVLVFNTPKKKE